MALELSPLYGASPLILIDNALLFTLMVCKIYIVNTKLYTANVYRELRVPCRENLQYL